MLAISRNILILFSAGLLLLLVGCGVSTEDIEATVQARIASIPTPTPQIVILEVVVTATPIPEPTVAQGNVYEWDDISLEFNNNAIVANNKYLNQTISIRGEVDSIDYRDEWLFTDDFSNMEKEIPTVALEATNTYRVLKCGLENIDEVENLSVGDTVIVNGKIGEWIGNWLTVYPCSIVD